MTNLLTFTLLAKLLVSTETNVVPLWTANERWVITNIIERTRLEVEALSGKGEGNPSRGQGIDLTKLESTRLVSSTTNLVETLLGRGEGEPAPEEIQPDPNVWMLRSDLEPIIGRITNAMSMPIGDLRHQLLTIGLRVTGLRFNAPIPP